MTKTRAKIRSQNEKPRIGFNCTAAAYTKLGLPPGPGSIEDLHVGAPPTAPGAVALVGEDFHERKFRAVAIDLELGDPKGWEYTVGGEPQTWWRIPVLNRKEPVEVTVRLTDIDPPVRLIVEDARLHRMGDDPPDEKYEGVTKLQHGERAWFDVVTMSPKAPGHDAVVVSSSTPSVTFWGGGRSWPLPVEFCIRTVDRPSYRMPVELNGTYRLTLTAHFGSKSKSRSYTLKASPNERSLTLS